MSALSSIGATCKPKEAFSKNDFDIFKGYNCIIMQEIGPQYAKDDTTDPSGFLRRARLHQSQFRANNLNLPYDEYGNYLTKADAESGYNFYDGFEILAAVKKRYKKYSKGLYSNMLRSEHIPFNMFVPFNLNKNFCKNVLNDFLNKKIASVDKIEIEYAPPAKESYLNDRTSFDTYIEYTHADNSKGILGIEVKYTEKEYKLKAGSKEETDISNVDSLYHRVTNDSNIYKNNKIDLLKTDKFRQIWRNHMLGESILLKEGDTFKHFTSLTLFPKANSHFVNTSKEYTALLASTDNKFLSVTYEDFFSSCAKYCPDDNYMKWLSYVKERYIVYDKA